MDETMSTRKIVSKYFDPAIILAVLTAATYLFGAAYTSGYFGRFGIFTSALDLPLDYFLTRAVTPIMFFAIPAAILLYIGMQPEILVFSAWISNLVLVFIGLTFILQGAEGLPGSFDIIGFLSAGWAFLVYVFLSWHKDGVVPYLLRQHSRFSQIGGVFILLASLLFLSSWAGRQMANREIDKSGANIYSVEFKWKQLPPPELQGIELDLVMHRDGKYYVVPFQSPVPQSPKLYIINEDQIEYAVTQRVK